MIERKRRLWQAIICIGFVIAIWGIYFIVMDGLYRQIEPCKDDFSWTYQIDSMETEGKELILRGFAFQLKRDAIEGSFEIVLQDISTGKNVFPKMKYVEREDVNKYFLCEYDYLNSGFEAILKTKKLDLENGNYEVLLRMKDKEKAYRTGTYLTKGQLVYTNPKSFEPLEVAGTDLEEIVTDGILRVYQPDDGVYVYQYEGALYWITEPYYKFDENGDTCIQYQLDTTQIKRLPQKRLDQKYYWDNISFQFREGELLGGNMGKYRVTKKSIPTEYSVEKIWTGNYKGSWIWLNYFRPYYQF